MKITAGTKKWIFFTMLKIRICNRRAGIFQEEWPYDEQRVAG